MEYITIYVKTEPRKSPQGFFVFFFFFFFKMWQKTLRAQQYWREKPHLQRTKATLRRARAKKTSFHFVTCAFGRGKCKLLSIHIKYKVFFFSKCRH